MYYYLEAVGLKTGSTGEAGLCLLSSASKNGMQVVSAVLHAEAPEIEPGVFQSQSFTETRRMFRWFFENFGYKDILKSSELIASIPVRLGKDADTVLIHPETGLRIILPHDVEPTEVFERKVALTVNGDSSVQTATAPIERGETLGEITLRYGNTTYGPIALVANSTVEIDHWAFIGDRALQTLDRTWIKVTFTVVLLLFALYLYIAFRRSMRIRKKRKQQAARKPERVAYEDEDDE
jgi:D-alanyl-D-alanine carboxypeptidase (penicillin-binding protein 5/6)